MYPLITTNQKRHERSTPPRRKSAALHANPEAIRARLLQTTLPPRQDSCQTPTSPRSFCLQAASIRMQRILIVSLLVTAILWAGTGVAAPALRAFSGRNPYIFHPAEVLQVRGFLSFVLPVRVLMVKKMKADRSSGKGLYPLKMQRWFKYVYEV